jgi:hypothetical protein
VTVPPHIRVVARGNFVSNSGALVGTGEGWSMSWKFSDGGDGIQTGAQASDVHVENIANRLGEEIDTNRYSNHVSLFMVTAYRIKADGKMDGNPNLFTFSGGTEPRGNGSVDYPPQVALVVTSVAQNRGPARFGRFYLPAPSVSLQGDMRLDNASAQLYLDSWVACLKDMSDEVDLGVTHSSELVNISTLQGGVQQGVDRLEVGRVLDTHRSRRRNLLEERVVGTHVDW